MKNLVQQFILKFNKLVEQDNILCNKLKDKMDVIYISFIFLIIISKVSIHFINLHLIFGYIIHIFLFINIYFCIFFIYKFYESFRNIKTNSFLLTLVIFSISILNYFYIIYLNSFEL